MSQVGPEIIGDLLCFVSGAPLPYATFVTSSNEVFALFLIKHYRTPPPMKRLKVTKLIKKEKQQEKHDDEEREDNNEKEDDEKEEEKDQDNKKTGRSTRSIKKEKVNLQKEN